MSSELHPHARLCLPLSTGRCNAMAIDPNNAEEITKLSDGTALGSRVFPRNVKVPLVHKRHRFAALKKLSELDELYSWKTIGFLVSLLSRWNGIIVSSRLILLYERSCINRADPVILDLQFLDTG